MSIAYPSALSERRGCVDGRLLTPDRLDLRASSDERYWSLRPRLPVGRPRSLVGLDMLETHGSLVDILAEPGSAVARTYHAGANYFDLKKSAG